MPQGRGDQRVLWLRTRLSGPKLQLPMLYLRLLSSGVQMFIDGEPVQPQTGVYTSIDRLASTRDEYLIPLSTDYAGKTLTLRLSSSAPVMGLGQKPRLGEAAAVALDLIRRSGVQGLMSLLFLSLSTLAGILFILRRTEKSYLYFAIHSAGMAIYNLSVAGLLRTLIPWPFPQLASQILSLALSYIALCSYIGFVLDLGPLRVLHWMRLLLLVFGVVALGVLEINPTLLIMLVQPMNLMSALLLLSLVATSVLGVRRGDADAKLLSLGLISVFVVVIPDLAVAAGVVSGEFGSNIPVAMMVFVLSLAMILLRRFAKERAHTVQLQIEHRVANHRLEEQTELLEAAARMAKGDLEKRIEVATTSPLGPLAVALDGMREDLQAKLQLLDRMQQDLQAKVETLETRNQEIGHLNDELRRQIEQRSRRLIDILLPSAGTPQVLPELSENDLLGDYYRIIRVVGTGGMGMVYEVERTTDGRRLAAKVLRGAGVDRTALGRFAREAQIMARMKHPSLVAISDVDVTSDGILFLVMELVSGASLGQLRNRFGQRTWVHTVLAQIADALAALHACGVVHRDLKPENVLIVEEGPEKLPLVKLADFGISMLVEDESQTPPPFQPAIVEMAKAARPPIVISETNVMLPTLEILTNRVTQSKKISIGGGYAEATLTKTGVILGTPIYMAPELALGSKHAHPAADIFSLGVLAYEMFAGQPPFAQPPILIRSLGGTLLIPPFLRNQAGLDPAVVDLIERCLATDPAQRPKAQDAAQVLFAALGEASRLQEIEEAPTGAYTPIQRNSAR